MNRSKELTNRFHSITSDTIRTYVDKLIQNGYTQEDISHKVTSIQKFISWAYYSDKISFSAHQQIKDEIDNILHQYIQSPSTEALNSSELQTTDAPLEKPHILSRFVDKIRAKNPVNEMVKDNNIPSGITSVQNRPFVFISMALLLLAVSIIGQGIYTRFFSSTKATLAYPSTPVVASRILSFQGRLTDSLGNPIVAATNMRFRLYTLSAGGTTLYDSGTCSISPDQDGVHNVLIGSDCGAEVSSSVFTENATVYMGVTVGSDSEMTPRQRIANVPYAQNSETLQGFPLGTEVSTVPYINSGGDLLIAAASPQIASTYASQAFVISSAQAVSLQSAGAGDVTLTATGSGELKFLVGGATAGVVNNSGNWGIKSSNPSTFELQVNGDVGPETDSTFDLGSNSVRWANVYADNIIGTITPGFTTGSVTFADSSGNLAQDNAQFFWDDTNNKLGIGTASPLAKFHLTGAATGKALAILNETGDQNILTASASGVTVANLDRSGNLSVEGALSDLSGATLEVNDNLDISGTLTSGTANAFVVDATGNISTSGTTGLTFSSTGGVNLAGGTLSDSSDGVDINDDLEISGGTTLGDASGDTVTANAASWTFANDTNYILSGGINGFSLDSTTFSVDGASDRIGIGTAAPDAAWLDIAANTTAKSQLNLTTSAGTNVSAPNSGDLWWNGTNLYFYNGSINKDLLASGGSVAGSDGQVQYNNGGSFGGASAFIYDDTNNRIGIGSATSPTTILHVAGAETGKALSIFDETGDQAIITASASGVTRYTLSNNGNITYSPAAYGTPITLYASDTTLPNANTGIVDAINDAYTAAIGGGGGLWTDSATTTYLTTTTDDLVLGGSSPLSSAKFSIDGDADQIQLIVQGNGTQTTNLATFEQSDGTDVLTVTNGGNLSLEGAINDISGNLSLNDSTDITGNLTISGTTQLGDNSADTVTSNAAAWTFASDTDFTLSGGVNGLSFDGTTFSVDATGNKIGIGNAAPVGKLDVSGAVTGKALTILNETGDQDILVGSASGNTRFRVTNDGTVHAGYLLDISNTAYGIDPAGTGNFGGYSMKVTGGALLAFDSGSVGIGATSPTGKLQVVGDETRFGDAGSVDIATGDGDVYIEDALEVDGTITAGDIACTDCLDFTEFEDTLDVDATTDINLGASNLTVDLDSTGIFDIRDGTTTFVSFDDDSTIDVTFPAAGTLGIDAAATDNTTTAGIINLDVDTATDGNIGQSIDYQVVDAAGNVTGYGQKIDVTVDTDAAQSHTVNGAYIGLTANDATSTTYGLHVVGEDAGGQVATAGILIENLQATDIDLTTGLLIRATTDGSLPTAIDVSDNEITTALSVGANTIAGTTGLIDYTNFDVDASGNVTIAGTTGVTFSSTGGINLAGGVLIDSTDGVDINDSLEIAGGTVTLTNGTSNLVSWGSAGAADPTTSSIGWKTKFYGDAYGLGVAGSTLWSVSDDTFKLYDNDTTTYNLKTTIGTDTDTYFQLYDNSLNEDIRFHTNGTSWFNGGGLVIGATATSANFQVVGDESRFGTAGTVSYAAGDGDVYIQDALEVDGLAYFAGGTIHLENATSDLINWGSDGAADPSTSSSGWKTKFYGDSYGLGVAGGAMWAVSDGQFRWYDNDATTYNWRADLDVETDASFELYNNSTASTILLNTNGTSYLNGGSVGINTAGPDAKLDVLSTTEQLRLTYTDGVTYAGLTVSSGGDLTLDVTGGQFLLADADTLNIGGVTGLAYNAISDSGVTSHGLASDDDLYVEGDVEVDGSLWADGTLTAGDVACTDCLDFDSLEDTLDLDATTDINLGANNLTVDLDSTGIFDVRDGATTFVSFDDDSTIDVTFPVAGTLGIDAAAADNTTTAGVINLDVDTATSGNIGSSIDYQVVDAAGNVTAYGQKIDVTVDTDAAQSHTVNGSYIGLIANDASSTTYGLHVVGEDAGGQVATAGILIENLQATDIDLTTGLLIQATTDGSLPTAIDASDAEITTALATGANNITGTNWGVVGSTGVGTFGGGTFNGNLDMTNDLILNIGDSGADFIAGGGLTLMEILTVYDDIDFRLDAGEAVDIAATATAPTVDMVTISNSGLGTTTSAVDGLAINFTATADGGADLNAGAQITIVDSGESTDTIYGLRVVAGTASDGTQYGINLSSLTGGAGAEVGMLIGAGWDTGIDLSANTLINIGNSGTDFSSSGGLTLADDLVVNGDDITSDVDLTINPGGGQVLFGDGDTFNIGGVSALAYNAISDSGGVTTHGLDGDDDLYVEGLIEADGGIFADGTITATDFACTDCLDFAEFEDTLDLDTTLIVNQNTNTWTQNFTGDTTNGLTYTADSLSTGNAVAISSTSTALSAGTLLSLDWSPASLVTNGDDLFKINTTTNGNMSAYYINLLKNSSSVFNVDQSGNVNAANILPRTNDTYDLGSDSFRWKDIYLGGETMHIGTSTTDEATLGYTTSSNLLTLTNNYGDTTFTTSSDGFNFVLGGGAGDDLIVDTDTLVVESDNNRVGIGTTAPDEKLHVAGNILVDAQSDATAHNFASGCNCSINSAAGTFGSETNRDKVTDSAVYKGKLFVAVQETDAAGVYRWDGGTTWQLVINAVGKVNSGDTANIDGFTMSVYKDMLVIGSQGTGNEAALFYSTDAHTGTTPAWTQANTTKGTFQTANISGVWDIAVYNGMLYLTTMSSDAAELIRWDGGTGFTQITQTDGKFMNADAFANIDQIHLEVYNNMLIAGAVTGTSGQARIAAYAGTGVGTTAVLTTLNTTGTFDALGSQFDVTNMEVYNGDLYIVTARANSAGIWRWNGTTPVAGVPTSFKLVTVGAGQIVSGDATDIDNIVLKTYNGRLYAGTSTGSGTSTAALYEFDGQNTWTLINTTRGTFDGTTNVDGISDLMEYNGTLYVGTEDLVSSVGSVYSWSKTSLNSYALKFNSGNSNYGAISFVGGQVVNDNEQHAGTFLLSHSISLDSAGFDVAEDYASYDMDLHANELVELDPDNREFVRRATKGTGGLIGVVSEEPGFRLAQSKTKLNGAKWSPIALVGRVPVKVTSENGPIRTGDPLTISSIPGVAMKATETGTSIGYAMENYDDEDPMRIGKITVFVNVGYNGKAIFADSDIRDGTVLEDENGFSFTTASGKVIQEVGAYSLLASAEIKAGFVESTKFATQTLTAFQATIDNVIVDTIVGRQATLTDAQIENLNAQALKAQLIEAETIKTATLEAEIATITGNLTAQDATISGTLVADNVDAQNIREMRERLERLALTQSDTNVTSEQLNADIEQVQQYIDELTNTETPEDVADVATYQLTSEAMSMDPGTTQNSLGQEVSSANLDSLIVTGTASMTSLTIADAFSTGNVFIQGNSVVSLVNDLKLSALESVDIMNGAVIIAKDGTITAKGEVIAQKGVRTNTIKSLDGTSDVAVVLDGTIDPSGLDSSHSAFRVQTADGNNVAHIDSSGSADFKGLSLSTYSEATSSAVVIAAGDNYRQTGLYVPAIKTNATASGNGFLPEGENDIIIFNDSIKKDTIVNLTPTSSTQNQSVYVDKVETCANSSNELCQPYFRVAIDDVIDTNVTFNWLIVN